MFSAAPTIIRSTDCRGCCLLLLQQQQHTPSVTFRCALTFLTTYYRRIFAPLFVSFNFPSLSPFRFFSSRKTCTAYQSRRVPPYSARVCVSLGLGSSSEGSLASLDVDLCGSHLNPAPFVFVRVADSPASFGGLLTNRDSASGYANTKDG